jgi:hypothetical protein
MDQVLAFVFRRRQKPGAFLKVDDAEFDVGAVGNRGQSSFVSAMVSPDRNAALALGSVEAPARLRRFFVVLGC